MIASTALTEIDAFSTDVKDNSKNEDVNNTEEDMDFKERKEICLED